MRQDLHEDVGGGDLTAALARESLCSVAHVLSREPAVLCGTLVRPRLPNIRIEWADPGRGRDETGHALPPVRIGAGPPANPGMDALPYSS